MTQDGSTTKENMEKEKSEVIKAGLSKEIEV